MAVIDTLHITVDATEAIKFVKDTQLHFASILRELPYVVAEDGTKWANVTDLILLAEKLEKDAS
jgi:hypothetical protein